MTIETWEKYNYSTRKAIETVTIDIDDKTEALEALESDVDAMETGEWDDEGYNYRQNGDVICIRKVE